MSNYSKKVHKLLRQQNKTITFAESITGGALAADLVQNCLASNTIRQAIVAYGEHPKQKFLGVSQDLMSRYGTISREVAEAMNEGLKKLFEADVYVSITGNAGPSFDDHGEEKKVAYVAIETDTLNKVYELEMKSNNRCRNIKNAVKEVYKLLEDILQNS